MHRFFRSICLPAAFLAALAASGTVGAAGKNTVGSIDLKGLDQMVSAESGHLAIVFMAAWCMPCIEELPAVNEIYKKYSSSGLHMLGLSLDLGGPKAIQPFVDEHKIRFPVYWVGEKAIKAYQIRGIPLILLVENGKISERIVGKRSRKELDDIISEFLK